MEKKGNRETNGSAGSFNEQHSILKKGDKHKKHGGIKWDEGAVDNEDDYEHKLIKEANTPFVKNAGGSGEAGMIPDEPVSLNGYQCVS
jgi:hypothetical protein